MMTHYDYRKYREMSDNPDNYFSKKKVVNFDLIHQQCRDDPLLKPEKDHKTISSDDSKKYPQQEKNKALSAVFRSNRDDSWIKRVIIMVRGGVKLPPLPLPGKTTLKKPSLLRVKEALKT